VKRYDFSGERGRIYEWKVIATNGSGGIESETRYFSIGGVSGVVYLDAENTCSTSTPSNFGGGLVARLRGTGYEDTVASDGSFGILAPSGSYTLDMTIPDGYVCSTGPLGNGCGGTCPSKTN
jgi:hypothetical protein